MYLRLLAVASIAVTGPAGAQMIKKSFAMPREYQLNLGDPRKTHEGMECLVHKKSDRVICKTPAEWRAEAARLDALQRPASSPR